MTNLVDRYIQYHKARTDAEINFGIILFLQCIGSLMGVRCYNNLAPNIVHHNIYAALIGKSSRSRKSTTQSLVRWLYPSEKCHPDDCSPEQFVAELEENPGYIWWYGEWSKILKRIDSGHYMSDIIEIMNQIFDCPETYKRKLRDKRKDKTTFEIKWPHLSFNTTITEEVLVNLTNEDMIAGGYFARFLLVYGEEKGEKRKILTAEDKELAGNLVSYIKALDRFASFFPPVLVFELTPDALDRHFEIEKKMYEYKDAGSFAGRYSNYLIAFADILMVCDKLGETPVDKLKDYKNLKEVFGTDTVAVTPEYLDRAWRLLQPHLEYSDKLARIVKADKPIRKFLSYVEGNKKESYTWSEIMRNAHLNATEMRLALDSLEQSRRVTTDTEIRRNATNQEYSRTIIRVIR